MGEVLIEEVAEVGDLGTQAGGRRHLTASRAGSQVPGRARPSRELPYPQGWLCPFTDTPHTHTPQPLAAQTRSPWEGPPLLPGSAPSS